MKYGALSILHRALSILHGALSILHAHLAVIIFCFNQDNHKQTMQDVKFNINNTNCLDWLALHLKFGSVYIKQLSGFLGTM